MGNAEPGLLRRRRSAARVVDELASAAAAELPVVRVGDGPVRLDAIVALAQGRARVVLPDDAAFLERLERGRAHLERHLGDAQRIYGVTTGFGERVRSDIDAALTGQIARNLVAFHGCGTGRAFDPVEGRAIVATRLVSLALGHSAVRLELLEALVALLEHDIVPCIPSEGSVGASGDLTPLSYLAAVLAGEREVTFAGRTMAAHEALHACGLRPLELWPKESLALMNGTSAMTALGCLAITRAQRLVRLGAALSATACDALLGNAGHFDARIFALKPHPGQGEVARWMREHLEYDPRRHRHPPQLQDRYSLRCAPHVLGVLADALPMLAGFVETELNSVNDNPIVYCDADPDAPGDGELLMGGNFYGGHIAFAMDSLKAAVANVADLLDRQLELMVNPATNHGLAPNLVAADGDEAATHHGFKAMQITASALTAEALKLTMPASVFSRSTESHNQDKVSMGTIAARDALRVLELVETVAAIHLLAACQALDLRERDGHRPRAASRALRDAVRESVAPNLADRRQDLDIARVLERLRAGELDGLLPAHAEEVAHG